MNKTIKKAYEIMDLQEKRFHDCLPEVEIGEQCELGDVWNGEGEDPEDSYSYLISNAGEDGESNYEIWINYEFKIIKEEENPLDTVIEITDICLL